MSITHPKRTSALRLTATALSSLAALLLSAAVTQAQTWSLSRQRPSLHEIIAVDGCADPDWPFGQEDLAGDGLQTTLPDEAAIDLRSLYADARDGQLWLRAYVSASVTPGMAALAFFFIDADLRTDTGGKASDAQLWPQLSDDPSPGGYERAIALRGDGTLSGVYFWDAQKKQWVAQQNPGQLVSAESGVARDPLRLAGDDHGYVQVELMLSTAELDDHCAAAFYVRTWNDAKGKRSFGDDLGALAADCHPQLDSFGDPALLNSDSCSSDATCPALGRCQGGLCLFCYECSTDAACASDERCTSGVCVRVVDSTCRQNADCSGLVCDAMHCVACSASGARACGSNSLCAPDGRCLPAPGSSSASQAGASGSRAPSGAGGAAAQSGVKIRGGAFTCTALRAASSHRRADLLALWLLAPLAIRAIRRRRRRAEVER